MPNLSFVKMHGCGNDFIVIDAVRRRLPGDFPAAQLADRKTGIGCDQILILQKPRRGITADFNYRIFNADGSEVGQCGNGARCAHAFLRRHKLTAKKRLVLQTHNTRIVTEDAAAGEVRAYLAVPEFAPDKIPLCRPRLQSWYAAASPKLPGRFAAVSLGNPHAIFMTERDDMLAAVGAALNNRAKLFPAGVNVSFCRRHKNGVRLRVYERGAGATMACGSAAAAATVILLRDKKVKNPLRVYMPGGELLCGWDGPGQAVWLQGKPVFVFSGEIKI